MENKNKNTTDWHTGHIFDDIQAGFKFTTHLHSHFFYSRGRISMLNEHTDPPEL